MRAICRGDGTNDRRRQKTAPPPTEWRLYMAGAGRGGGALGMCVMLAGADVRMKLVAMKANIPARQSVRGNRGGDIFHGHGQQQCCR